MKKYISEFIGTLVLVLIGCGVAVICNGNDVAIALAFGLSVVAMAYSVGVISGGHFNPAITLGMYIDKRIKGFDAISYIIAQVLGAIAGSLLLYFILSSTFIGTANLGANGFGELSATNITCLGAIVVEVVLTFIFVYTALVATSNKDNNHAGIVIGLTLALVHLIGINLTGTSVNPARSLAPALLLGGKAFSQVWVFILAPLLGAACAGAVYKLLNTKKKLFKRD